MSEKDCYELIDFLREKIRNMALCQRSQSADAQELIENAEKYNELIMAVEGKYEGETRHDTALRLIRQAQFEIKSGAKVVKK